MAAQKKTSTAKSKSSSTAPSLHPPYLQMITDAITTMKDRTGSSQPSIAKYIEENYTPKQLPPNFRKMLSMQLKRFVKSEKLVKVKNSYKIPSTEKAKKLSDPPTAKKTVAVAKQSVEKAKKTKRLSQVKTPEGFKKGKSPVKIGEKKKVGKAAAPAKRKAVTDNYA